MGQRRAPEIVEPNPYIDEARTQSCGKRLDWIGYRLAGGECGHTLEPPANTALSCLVGTPDAGTEARGAERSPHHVTAMAGIDAHS